MVPASLSPDHGLRGYTALVTGATSGIGWEVALRLARRGCDVVATGRDAKRGEALCSEARAYEAPGQIVFEAADLSDFGAVRKLGTSVRERWPRLDLLILNAGTYYSDLRHNAEGIEMTMAVNQLGHFLLTSLLLERVRAASGRVIVVTSEAHRTVTLSRPIEAVLRGRGHYRGLQAYGESKLLNLLFALELAGRTAGRGVVVHAVHPGLIATRIWNRNRDLGSRIMRLVKPFMGRPSKGARAVLHAATDRSLGRLTGLYLDGLDVGRASSRAHDQELAAELWSVSERLTGSGPWP